MPRSSSLTPPEVVSPLWLLKAVAVTIVAALLCGWFALCLLFYQGQWQLVLHPALSTQPLSSFPGIPATPIRFDAAATGVPRLSGVLIPTGAPDAYTVLYLRGGESSLAQSPTDAANLALLHGLGLAVFAFDYGGFGSSEPTHPTVHRMTGDAAAAFHFLLDRNIPESHIILYGTGVGASLATALASTHPAIPALILDAPTRPSLEIADADPRTRALPVRWLFHEEFSLTGLATLATPKLLISYPPPNAEAFRSAATPKITLELPANAPQERTPAIKRFLDQYLPR